MFRVAATALGLLCLVSAEAPRAAPTLFSGNVSSVNDPALTYSKRTYVLPGAGTLSVMGSSPASFTVPPYEFGYFAAIPPYTNSVMYKTKYGTATITSMVTLTITRLQIGNGSFSPLYLSPSKSYVAPANTTASPMATTPRVGLVRLKLGSQGFGGNMPIAVFDPLTAMGFTIAGNYLTIRRYHTGISGSGPLGVSRPTALKGNLYYASPYALITSIGASTRAPWITGTVTASQSNGILVTASSAMGSDARNASGSGTISLVTARLLFVYRGSGGVPSGMNYSSAYTSKLTLSLPEPGRLMLLASGLLGLFWLRRLRA